jgi:hypothetical protein
VPGFNVVGTNGLSQKSVCQKRKKKHSIRKLINPFIAEPYNLLLM